MSNMTTRQYKFMMLAEQTCFNNNTKQAELYTKLITEEFNEFIEATKNETTVEQLKEAGDILVTTMGFIYSLGVCPERLMKLVQYNNLQKVKHKPTFDKQGKVQKSPESIAAKADMLLNINKLLKEVMS